MKKLFFVCTLFIIMFSLIIVYIFSQAQGSKKILDVEKMKTKLLGTAFKEQQLKSGKIAYKNGKRVIITSLNGEVEYIDAGVNIPNKDISIDKNQAIETAKFFLSEVGFLHVNSYVIDIKENKSGYENSGGNKDYLVIEYEMLFVNSVTDSGIKLYMSKEGITRILFINDYKKKLGKNEMINDVMFDVENNSDWFNKSKKIKYEYLSERLKEYIDEKTFKNIKTWDEAATLFNKVPKLDTNKYQFVSATLSPKTSIAKSFGKVKGLKYYEPLYKVGFIDSPQGFRVDIILIY